jgi:hypothetical protein
MCGYANRSGAAILRPLRAPYFLIRRASQTGFPLCAARDRSARFVAPGLATAADSTATGVALVEICELPE